MPARLSEFLGQLAAGLSDPHHQDLPRRERSGLGVVVSVYDWDGFRRGASQAAPVVALLRPSPETGRPAADVANPRFLRRAKECAEGTLRGLRSRVVPRLRLGGADL